MKMADAEQYAEFHVTMALDADATVAKLDETFSKLAHEISPRDAFVLCAAAHGYSIDGQYYMVPQDYQGGPNLEGIATLDIGQDRIQEWIANRIKATRVLALRVRGFDWDLGRKDMGGAETFV
jgi:hypothetical protein